MPMPKNRRSPTQRTRTGLNTVRRANPDLAIAMRTKIIRALLECVDTGDRRPEVIKELSLQIEELNLILRKAALGN
jgi:hypothetical protein